MVSSNHFIQFVKKVNTTAQFTLYLKALEEKKKPHTTFNLIHCDFYKVTPKYIWLAQLCTTLSPKNILIHNNFCCPTG